MNSQKTVFLIVLVLIVGGLVFWDHQNNRTTSEGELHDKRLIDIDAKGVTQVELIRSNQTIVMVLAGDNWEIKLPVQARADYSTVSAMLDGFEFAEHSRVLTEHDMQSATLSDFGLDPPRETVKLQYKNTPVILRIGSETPTRDALYVQVAGHKEVYVTSKTLLEQADQTLVALRDRTVIDFTPSAVTRLEISDGSRSIELSRSISTTNSESRWSISRPIIARADQTKINELITNLNGLRVLDFVSDDPKEVPLYHLTEEDHEVTVYTGDAGKTLLLGQSPTNDPAKVYAKLKSADSIVTVLAESVKKLAVQINDLRDARVLAFNTNEVTAIEIAHGIDKIDLKRDDASWKLTAPIVARASDDSTALLFQMLASLRAKQFAADVATDLDQYGLAVPAAVVTFRGDGTNILAQLLVGSVNATNGMRYVKNSDEPFIYAIATNVIDQLPASYGNFRSRTIFELNPEQVTKIAVGDVTIAHSDKGLWSLVSPSSGVLDVDAANALLNTIATLDAQSFGRPKADTDATTGYVIKVYTGDTPQWLAIGPDGLSAASSVELTFRLSQPVIDILTKKLVTTPKLEPILVPPATNAPAAPKS